MTVSEDFFQINQLIPLCFNPHILFFPSNQDISPLSKGNGNGKEERDSFQGAKQTKISPRCALFSSNLEITLIRSITIGASFPLSFPRRVAYLFMRISPAARGGAGGTTRLQRKREERRVFRGYCSLWNRIGGTWRADAAIYAAHARDEHRLQRETLPLRAKDFARGRLPSNSFRDSRKSREFSVLEGCIFLSYPFDDLLFFKGRRFFILFFAMILIVRFNF